MNVVAAVIVCLLFTTISGAQEKLPIIKSNGVLVSIRDGRVLKKDEWILTLAVKPAVYEADLINGKAHKVEFITDVESIGFTVEEGKKYDFIIQRGGELFRTQIVGKRFVPAARFDKKYQVRHRGKTFIEIPEVYELVNVAIAITPTALADENLVYRNSGYYKNVRGWFDKHRGHRFIADLEAALKKDRWAYFSLKMNGYAFEFDEKGRIVRSKVYDRTGFRSERTNTLLPFLAQMQSFADESNFRQFYRENQKTYDEQIAFYRDAANVAEMKRWLDKNFPASNDYDVYKIIFSPLVAYNQSTTWFESKGFKELQPHVNFPYVEDVRRFSSFKMSEQAEIAYRGDVVFTEINHGYVNPEAAKYAERISKAISNRERWVDKSKPAAYYAGNTTFNEYMNWGLVSLRYLDYVPQAEQGRMIAKIDFMMTKSRGFPMFEAFDKFLVDLYRNRKPNQTVADLFPQIIEWFERNN